MQRYVLTERGKFLIAILAIVLFLLTPALIFVIRTLTMDPSSNGTESFTPDSSPGTSSGSSQDPPGGDSIDPATLDPSVAGPIDYDIANGTMAFLFTPDLQTSLDDNTVSMIGELLSSPKNTNTSKIAVEIPQLPDDEVAIVTTAIINAFATYEVPLSDIVFFIYHPEMIERTLKINISFQ